MPSHIPDRDDELRRFKTELNLTRVAAAYGFEVDRKKTSRHSVSMVHADGSRIVIDRKGDTWMFWSPGGGPAGSVIDFVQSRSPSGQRSLGHVRRALRTFSDGSASTPLPSPGRYVERVEPVPKDLDAVRRRYEAAACVHARGGVHAYLNEQRGLSAALLGSDRFRLRSDGHGNALWAHFNADKVLCGYEVRGAAFKGFASGGVRGLGGSRKEEGDRRLVVAESFISGLSFFALHDDGATRLVTTGGTVSHAQAGLLNRAIRKLAEGAEVVLAVDHDDGGQRFADSIEPIFKHVRDTLSRADLTLAVHKPPTPGDDWNDHLLAVGVGSQPHDPEPGP